jgi:hypothetical protein
VPGSKQGRVEKQRELEGKVAETVMALARSGPASPEFVAAMPSPLTHYHASHVHFLLPLPRTHVADQQAIGERCGSIAAASMTRVRNSIRGLPRGSLRSLVAAGARLHIARQ